MCVALLVPGLFPAGAFAAEAQAETATQGDVLVICPQVPGDDLAPQVEALCEALTFMAKSYLCQSPDQVKDPGGWAYIVVMLPVETRLPDALAQKLKTGDTPVLVIGPGGLDQLAATRTLLTGVFSATYTFSGDYTARWNSEETTLRLLREWDADYGGETGLLGGSEAIPLCAGIGNIASIPWLDGENTTMRMALANMVTQWMWPYQNSPWSYSAYLVLDRVFPFDDPEKLMALSDMLVEENVPYAICVMPIYDNAYFPAMQRFCEYLRYAQSKGAAIVMRAPQAVLANTDTASMKEHIELAYDAYTQYGVYPVALAAPTAWLYSEDGLSLLNVTRTVLLFDTDEEVEAVPRSNLSHRDGHYLAAPARSSGGRLYTNAYSTAVYLDVNEDTETLRTLVRGYKHSSITLRSLWNLSASLYVGVHYFKSEPGEGMWFDGALADLGYTPFEYEEDFNYQRGFFQFLTEQIETSNKLIIALVLVSGTIFLYLIIFARRRMRSQFLVKPLRDKGREP